VKKINIVKKSLEFNEIMHNGKKYKNDYFIVYTKGNDLNRYRFGITVGKKISNAVNRNKLKRQVRNILDYHKNLYSKSQDYIIILRKSSLNEKYSILEENLIKILEKMEKNYENK